MGFYDDKKTAKQYIEMTRGYDGQELNVVEIAVYTEMEEDDKCMYWVPYDDLSSF